MARVTIFGTSWATDLQAILLSQGHVVSIINENDDVADVVATTPDVIVSIFETSDSHVNKVIDLHELGYNLLLSGATSNTSRRSSAYHLGLIGTNSPLYGSTLLDLEQPHILFTEAGILTPTVTVLGQGSGVGLESNPEYILARMNGKVIISHGREGDVSLNGYVLKAPVLMLGLLAFGYSDRNTDSNYRALVESSIKLLSGGKYLITGVTRDKVGELNTFKLRAYDGTTGKLLASTVSNDTTGVYEIDPLAPLVRLMCITDDTAVPSLVKDEVDHTVNNDFDFSASTSYTPPPTFQAMITGNVTQLGEPKEIKVIALNSEGTAVLGETLSDSETGDYAIDVQPYQAEVLLCTIPEYGSKWVAEENVTEGQIIHPETPNKYVYTCLNDGALGLFEPVWSTGSLVTSGTVTLKPTPLHRPLMNGFVKPTVTPL